MPGKPGAPEHGNTQDEERYWRDMRAWYANPAGWGITYPPYPIPPKCKCGENSYTVHGVLKHLDDNLAAGDACPRLHGKEALVAAIPAIAAPAFSAPPSKMSGFGKKR